MVTGMGRMTNTSGMTRMMRISCITWIIRMVKTRVATCRVTGMTVISGMIRMTYWVYWEDLVDWNGLRTCIHLIGLYKSQSRYNFVMEYP